MFRYSNRRTDPDVVEIYMQKLGNIPIDELKKTWSSLDSGEYYKAQLPSAELIYKTWKGRSKLRDEKKEYIQSQKKPSLAW